MSHAVRQGPDWTCVTAAAQWQPRDSTGRTVHQNQLWILGGWFTPQTPNPRDVWRSADGKNWTRVLEVAPWEQSDLPVCLTFKNRIWFMGGRTLPGTAVSNKVWSSADGADWRLECPAAGWSPRLGASYCVFKDRMWVMGGTSDFYQHDDTTVFNDVWSSEDGKKWTLVNPAAPWSKRCHGAAVVMGGKMWVAGGGTWKPQGLARNDVWCSEDGEHWDCVTEAAPWDPRIWFGFANYREHLWVFAGWNKDRGNFADVWCSKNGRDWTEVKSQTIWKARHEPAFWVHDDKLWLGGGCGDALDSEIWTLQVDEAWLRG